MGDFIVHRARFFGFQPKAIQSMSFDDNLKKLAVSRSDNTIEIWCTRNEILESIIYPTADRQVEVVLWCRSQLLSAGLDGFVVLYDLARLTARKLVPSVGGAIWCMTRNKSETRIAVGTEDGYIVLYEIQIDGILFEKTLNKQDSRILSLAWHRDEEILVTGGIDNIRVWDVNSGQVLQRISLGRLDKKKETLVWCLNITSNFQIISGDSRGKVSVWNAEQGSLIKSFQTHSVDVLCLCMDESESHVYCSGIDPAIVQLDVVRVNEAEDFKSWVKSSVYYNHTHDVRSMLIADNELISAGVDTKIVFKSTRDDNNNSSKPPGPSIRKYNSMPQMRSLIDTVDDFVLLQYDKHLELWKLGNTPVAGGDLGDKKDGDYLPILRSPRKYLHLNSKNDLGIVCSSIGSDTSNTQDDDTSSHVLWLSYSDLNVIHIYRVEISSKQVAEPKITINKIKQLPLACGNRPAVIMKFYSYRVSKDMAQLRLCYLTNKSCIQCLNLVNDEIGFALECTIQCIPQDLLLADNRVYLMSFKDDYAATADTDLNLTIWSLKSQQQLCVLPRHDHLVACMTFHPEKKNLLVCYADRKIIEYDFDANEYTDWSRENTDRFPRQWYKVHTKLLNCFYVKSDPDKFLVHDEQYLAVVNKKEPMPTDKSAKVYISAKSSQSSSSSSSSSNALHISNKYRYMLHVSQPKEKQLLVVEVTPLSVSERLPPSLKQKKFGT